MVMIMIKYHKFNKILKSKTVQLGMYLSSRVLIYKLHIKTMRIIKGLDAPLIYINDAGLML